MVIAILASISVVAYNGVQARAHSAAAATSRNGFVKLLKLYKTDKGTYPNTGMNTVCLGNASDYMARDGFSAGQCRYSDYSAIVANVSTPITTELTEYGSIPSVNWTLATEYYEGYGTDYYRGIFYNSSTNGDTATVWYLLKGNHTCPGDGYGGYDPDTGETQCSIQLK